MVVDPPLHTFSKLYDVPVGFVSPPPPHLKQCIALFAVAERWLLLDIGLFVLFFSAKVTHTSHTFQNKQERRLAMIMHIIVNKLQMS